LIAVLLGPNGQLGTDVQKANAASAKPLTIKPVGRADIDLEDVEQAARKLRDMKFDALVNCSSYHKTDEVEKNAQKAMTINAHLVRRLAEICTERKARFVHISTDYVFGGQAKREPLVETDGKAPLNVYGASKGMGEDLALLANPDSVILRVASLFGVAGASGKGGNFVETMIKFGRERGELNVVADQVMSPTSTTDIAAVLLKMLQQGAAGGLYHVVNSGEASWYDFATRIIERAGVAARVLPITSAQFQTPAKRPPYSVLSNAKVNGAFGAMRLWQDALDDYLVAKGYRSATASATAKAELAAAR
jgi:dTDP-4-dehydrorhamnose reductase